MSRKRGKKHKPAVEAVPDDILAEGSGPIGRVEADAISTVEDVATTDDIATTEDVVTADDIVATAVDSEVASERDAPGHEQPMDLAGDAAAELGLASDEDNLAGGATDAPLDVAEVGAAGADDAAGAGNDLGEAGEGGGGGGAGEAGEGDEDDAAIVFPTSAATMDAVQFKHLVEALIFASDRPLTVQRLRQLTRVGDVRRLEQALVEIAEDYRERGLVLQQVSGGYQFRTRTQFSAWVQQLIAGRPVRLSRAQLETLAIIAYRQPITRPEIDDIRGVDSSATLKLLIDRMLIRVLGKREEVGRPMLYGTTKEFLDFFSLGDLRELPTLREYSELTAESRKVMSDRLGIAPDGGDGNGSGGPGDGGDGEGGPGDGGNGDGEAGGAGGEGGGGPMPGFDGSDGTTSDDGGAPANAMASDLTDAVASFLSAADAVDRSDAAALADPDDLDLDDEDRQEPADHDELAGDELAGDELAGDDPGDRTDGSLVEAMLSAAADLSLAHDETERADREAADGSLAEAMLSEAADLSHVHDETERADREAADGSLAEAGGAAGGSPAEAGAAADTAILSEGDGHGDGGGEVDGDAEWPAGSQRFPVIASIDDRPVEPPAMDSNVIGAGVLDDGHGDAVTAAALATPHVEPAAE